MLRTNAVSAEDKCVKTRELFTLHLISTVREPPTQVDAVDLRLSIMKLLGARWTIKVYDYMKSKPEII